MPRLPTERDYVTGMVPPEMLGTEADPATDNSDLPDGVSVSSEAGLTRVRIPAPAVMPSASNVVQPDNHLKLLSQIQGAVDNRPLIYDFALLPDVQCHLVLQGPANADHLEQLTEYLLVAVRKLREQEQRRAAEPKSKRKKEAEE